MSVYKNIETILEEIPENVKLIAVSKTKPNEAILEAYEGGYRIFGENKPQEMVGKYETLPKDIEWHMIGHLQTNKVKYIAPFVTLIHAVDSIKLLKMINKEAKKNERTIDCLLQFHIADEETKFGFSKEEVEQMFETEEYKELKNIHSEIKDKYFKGEESFKEISMGMSGDYKLAIEQGSTIIRVGSSIFGARNYGVSL